MKNRFVGAMVVILGGIVVTEPLLACGDKYRMLGRPSVPPPARSAASILVYANPALNFHKALKKVSVDTTLSEAGYRPTIVASPEEFTTAMRRGRWDLVLVDVAESSAPITQDPAPLVLRMAFEPTNRELDAAKKLYGRVLKAPTKPQAFLEAIDDALASKPSVTAQAKGNPGR